MGASGHPAGRVRAEASLNIGSSYKFEMPFFNLLAS